MATNTTLGCGKFTLIDNISSKRWSLTASINGVEQLHEIETSDTSPIQGVVQTVIDRHGQSHLIGYYSAHQEKNLHVPEYEKSQFIFIDKLTIGLDGKKPVFHLKKGWKFRQFKVYLEGKKIVDFEYKWPWHREIIVRDDFDYISKDIIYLLISGLKLRRKEWVGEA